MSLLSTVAFAAAQPVAPSSDTAPSEASTYRVVVSTDVAPGDESELSLALQSQLVDLPVQLEIVAVPAGDPSFTARSRHARQLAAEREVDLVVWFSYEPDQRMFVFLSEPGRGRTLVRELGDDAVPSPHTVALLVRSVVEALVQGGRIGVEVPEPELEPEPEPEPEPEAKPEPIAVAPRRPSVPLLALIGVGYRPTVFSASYPVMHTLTLGAELLVGRHAAVFGRGGVGIPIELGTELVDVRVQPFTAQLGGRGHARLGRWELGGRFGGLVEILRREVVAIDPAVLVDDASTRTLVALSPGMALGWWAHPRVRLGLEVGVDAHIRPLQLVVAGPSGDVVVAETLAWRPWATFRVDVQPVSSRGSH
ncbi:MAG: hypothetical protein AAF799_09880 [Myxococcota bacterium]